MMNVLHIDEQTGWRGGEQQASYLIDGLAAAGHRCLVAGRPGSPFLTRDHGSADVVRMACPFRGELDLYTAWKLSRIVVSQDIDILHAHTSHSHTLACIAKRMAGRGKVVVSRRVDFVPKPTITNRYKYAMPDRIVAISDAIRRILVDFGVPSAKVALVHSGVDRRRFDVTPQNRAAMGIPDGVPLVGSVGALVGHKDHGTLLRAFARLRDMGTTAHLVIVGEGPLRGALEEQIRDLRLGDTVTLVGHRTDVPALLPLFDVFAMSSREEGLGTSVLDAMTCGIPVVGTDAGGIPEMVKNGETGLLVPKENPEALAGALKRLLDDRAMGLAMAQRARALVEDEFSVSAMVAGNLRVYESLVGG